MELDIIKLKQKFNLTNSEEAVLMYVLNNLDLSLKLGVRGVGKNCYSSTSVVMNLAKKLNYSGFLDMVYNLKFQFEQKKSGKDSSEIDDEIRKLAQELYDKKDRIIYVVGTGFSKMVAEYIHQKLLNLGFISIFSDFYEIYDKPHSKSGMLIIVSKSGETDHPLTLGKKASNSGIQIALFTGNKNSSLGKLSKNVIEVYDDQKLDDKNIMTNYFFAKVIIAFETCISEYLKFQKKNQTV